MGLLDYLEPLATVASGVVAEPLAGWYGLLGGGGSGVENARNALTYSPRTEGGKKKLQQLGGLLGDAKRVMVDENPPVRMVVNGYGAATDYVADRSPVAGAALATVPAAAGMFLGNAGAPARAAFGSAGRSATELGMRTAMAAERGLVPIVNQTMQRGGLPAQLLTDMSNKTRSNMILFHGSNENRPLKEIKNSGVFGGLFTSPSQRSASSHGDALYRMTVPDNKIMGLGEVVPYDDAFEFIRSKVRGSNYADEITDMVQNGKSAFESSISEDDLMRALSSTDLGEADWALQNLRGQLGAKHGYKAVAMPDEHGMSYLVLPGTKPRPANKYAKDITRER